MIIVTGANGKLGRMVVERLLDRGEKFAVCVRDPQRAQDLAERGVEVRQADFADSAGLDRAFVDASRVLVVSVDATGERALRLHESAIDAARRAGVERIVYTSHMAASPTSLFAPMPDHAATEAVLRASGVPFTSLRNGFYATSAVMLFGNALDTGELVAPQDGPVSWTAHADLARVAAIALTEDVFDGPTPALTGAAAIDLAQLAAIASERFGRPVRRVVVSDADFRDRLVANGVPAHAADLLIGMFAASRAGEFALVDPTLADLLGRPPVAVGEVLSGALLSQ